MKQNKLCINILSFKPASLTDTYLEQKQTFHIMVNNVSESHCAFKCRSVI